MKMFTVRHVADGAWVTGPVVTEQRLGPYLVELTASGVAGFQVDYVGVAEDAAPAEQPVPAT